MTSPESLADDLSRSGYLTDRRWHAALAAVPRELFIPAAALAVPVDGAPRYPIDRDADPDTWRTAVYTDTAIVTQLDDGATDLSAGVGDYTSSASAPGIVVDFLELLDPYPGDQILEIGTGTGWTAALLTSELGAEAVTTIEVDDQVAKGAATNLERAELAPTLIVGDGTDGWADGAPYDGVHVTCGVRTVPRAWVAQTRPGGRIVLPWVPGFGHGHQARLTVIGEGCAVGRFTNGSTYMMLRSQRPPAPAADEGGDWREGSTLLDPRRVVGADPGAHVAIAGMLPGLFGHGANGEAGTFQLWLWDGNGSAARVAYDPRYTRCGVEQQGPRALWDELERAYLTWVGWGQPGRARFGLTVTTEGQQVWLDEPTRLVADLT
ncbi:protein-L-isoaspartate(D-aspartate) O-methyltransferase [Nocardiopsis dassonvillei]|uniref:methyltransferase domain-containing protein n=1 Tax=Nocardiopsis dassonvillei TaxID=2014 RepID=UPI00200F322B|nr:methyltransferase domain-containing protein [Nocardiopsis dassonvillei]MCK9871692.1 protein-L-isoaspartate(D-aspartate) O-methyltransferase [Nocardiopsis dassonvillei]